MGQGRLCDLAKLKHSELVFYFFYGKVFQMMDLTHLRYMERGRNFSACHMWYLPRYAPLSTTLINIFYSLCIQSKQFIKLGTSEVTFPYTRA